MIVIFNCLGIYYATYSVPMGPCEETPGVIYRVQAVTAGHTMEGFIGR